MSDDVFDQEKRGQAIPEHGCGCAEVPGEVMHRIIRLQILTLIWMVVECGLALLSAWRAHSPVLLAFGADSLVELLSAMVVLLQFVPLVAIGPARATKVAGGLLLVLAAVITMASGLALWRKMQPETSWLGMGVTAGALVMMPVLSITKRRAARAAHNHALAADAVQSAACAYLAGITLAGSALNAALHIRWIDPVAALIAVPVIGREGTDALKGKSCC